MKIKYNYSGEKGENEEEKKNESSIYLLRYRASA